MSVSGAFCATLAPNSVWTEPGDVGTVYVNPSFARLAEHVEGNTYRLRRLRSVVADEKKDSFLWVTWTIAPLEEDALIDMDRIVTAEASPDGSSVLLRFNDIVYVPYNPAVTYIGKFHQLH